MPIYAYKCDSCGHAKDVLQKMSDDPLTQCPSCGAPTFNKQLTAAGFQLKGSGWYATDFKGGASGSSGTSAPAVAAGTASTSTDSGGASASTETSAAASPAACGASCACH
jgi:putative FmdB family regulatory protein